MNNTISPSHKVKPKKAKSGMSYVVFEELPSDQQKAWKNQGGCYTVTQFEEEGEKYCPYYHDYEGFYDNWIIGRKSFHLD